MLPLPYVPAARDPKSEVTSSSLYRLYSARSAEKTEVTPSSLYEMALREAPKYQSSEVNEITAQEPSENGTQRSAAKTEGTYEITILSRCSLSQRGRYQRFVPPGDQLFSKIKTHPLFSRSHLLIIQNIRANTLLWLSHIHTPFVEYYTIQRRLLRLYWRGLN